MWIRWIWIRIRIRNTAVHNTGMVPKQRRKQLYNIFIWIKPDLLHVSRCQHADNLVPANKIVYLTAACSLANI
jgi:hypothetical protein